MKLLLIGGTKFVGRHLVQAAQVHGHEVTIFHRGQTNAGLYTGVEELLGDRKVPDHLKTLGDRSWDAVIDTCGFFPADVCLTADVLRDSVGRYVFISSISAYADLGRPGANEDWPLATTEYAGATEISSETYGPLKALCEGIVRNHYGDRATIVRPGLIVGPHDPTGRFTHWPARIAHGGEVLAPGSPARNVQFIDARDVADFALRLSEAGITGTYNVTGPKEPLTMRQFLEVSREIIGGDATFTWVSDRFLEQNHIAPFTGLPLWIPEDCDFAGAGAIDCARARAAGLTFRPIEQTVLDTLAWDKMLPQGAALTLAHEHEILMRWHALSTPYRSDT